MAQKTPLPALTVMYADRWNSTWFTDLENFRTQLMEDYHLRFLLTGFLRLKKQWLYLLSIHKSGGFYFFQVVTLNSFSAAKFKPVLESKDENRQKLVKINYFLKKNKLFQNTDLDVLKRPIVPHWKKRISYKKSLVWSALTKKSVILKHGFYTPFNQNKSFKMKNRNIKTNSNFMTWSDWIKLNHNKVALTYYNSFLVKFIYKPKTTFNVLYNQKQLKNKKQITMTMLHPKNKSYKKNQVTFKRNFSTLVPVSTIKTNKQNQILLKNLYRKNNLNTNFAYRLSNSITKKHKGTYKMLYLLTSYFYKRMFRYKKYATIKLGYRALIKKYGHKLKYTHLLRRLGNSMLFICKALNRVTAMQNYVYYLPMSWSKDNYKFLKKAVVFERYVYQKSFVPSLALLHLAMSRGSANLIIDLLVRKLRRAFLHVPFLSAVEHICRFFMAPYEGNMAFNNSLCKGMDIIFKGKVNGSDRAKTWRFKFGPVHTATFYTNTREQVAKCVTRYGVFNIRVRLKLGAIIND